MFAGDANLGVGPLGLLMVGKCDLASSAANSSCFLVSDASGHSAILLGK